MIGNQHLCKLRVGLRENFEEAAGSLLMRYTDRPDEGQVGVNSEDTAVVFISVYTRSQIAEALDLVQRAQADEIRVKPSLYGLDIAFWWG